MSRHPTDPRLMRWLESGRPRRVGRHVEACDTCLERVEVVSDLDGGLRSELESASAPPEDLHRRTTGGVQGRLAAEDSLVAWLELFSVPWQTAATLMEIDPLTPQRGDTPPGRTDRHDAEDHGADDDEVVADHEIADDDVTTRSSQMDEEQADG